MSQITSRRTVLLGLAGIATAPIWSTLLLDQALASALDHSRPSLAGIDYASVSALVDAILSESMVAKTSVDKISRFILLVLKESDENTVEHFRKGLSWLNGYVHAQGGDSQFSKTPRAKRRAVIGAISAGTQAEKEQIAFLLSFRDLTLYGFDNSTERFDQRDFSTEYLGGDAK